VSRPQWLPSRIEAPGIVLAGAIGVVSVALARALPPSPLVSDVLVAMVLGALVLNTPLRRVFGLEVPSAEREPDRYAHGLRYTGKWVLRLSIILMGMKVETSLFRGQDLLLVAGVCAASVPSAFFVAHSLGAALGVRRPLADLLAAGTMICGASAVNATAPVCGAHRQEQGLAIGVVFLFSVFAMLTFRGVAGVFGVDPVHAGLWSGLAVNDLSSAVAVGAQMGGAGGVMAAASKSARILLLAPMLVTIGLLRREPSSGATPPGAKRSGMNASMKKSIVDALPGFILGYVGLAVVRALGDRAFGAAPLWRSAIAADKLLLDVLVSTVSAGIGLHLAIGPILATSGRALVVSGGTSIFMAGLTLAMIASAQRGAPGLAVAIGVAGLALTYAGYRAASRSDLARLHRRFDAGLPVALGEATRLLEAEEAQKGGALDEAFARKILAQLQPSIGELIPARTSPLGHGEGCRWVTYWEGKSGWALVAIVREPGAATPIHAHPHRLLGKAIEGALEELRFREVGGGANGDGERAKDVQLELVSREVLGHNELVETDGLATLHVVRAVSRVPSIDLQLRGPEVGRPGRRVRVDRTVDVTKLDVGARVGGVMEIDDRPGHGGEGAAAGRIAGSTPERREHA
jgi:uncharacterized membrane protein YadS